MSSGAGAAIFPKTKHVSSELGLWKVSAGVTVANRPPAKLSKALRSQEKPERWGHMAETLTFFLSGQDTRERRGWLESDGTEGMRPPAPPACLGPRPPPLSSSPQFPRRGQGGGGRQWKASLPVEAPAGSTQQAASEAPLPARGWGAGGLGVRWRSTRELP